MDNLGPRLRTFRLEAGLTLREMAHQVDVSPSFVSQIENGKSKPSVATLYAFAKLLGVSVDELFESKAAPVPSHPVTFHDGEATERGDMINPSDAWQPSEYANRVSVVHPSHRSTINRATGVTWQRLAATPERSTNFMEMVYAPGATSNEGGDMVSHEGYEYGYVTQGELEITIGDEVFTLRAGESIGFDALIPHIFTNTGTEDFHGIWFIHGRGA